MKQIQSDFSIKDYIVSPVGTCLQGYINCSYSSLCKKFGKPNSEGDAYKVQAEWVIDTPAGIATIYDYKQGDCYNGKGNGIPKTKVTEWHIGGKSEEVVVWVTGAMTKDF